MNLEEFLARGYKLVSGDIIRVDDWEHEVYNPTLWNSECPEDYLATVFKAKALEVQPKRCEEYKALANRIKELEKQLKEFEKEIERLSERW